METLSRQQQALVTYGGDRHLMVKAAPGSGKTRTIAERIAYLIDGRKLRPEQTLVMTFSNQAAAALRRRVDERLSSRAATIQIGTFHSLCERWLRDEGDAIGIASSFVRLDAAQQQRYLVRAIQQTANRANVRDNPRYLYEIADRISERKRQPERLDGGVPADDSGVVERIDTRYHELLRANNALDFDDLILNMIALLRDDQAVATRLRRRFTHLFLDEYHDVSPEQYRLISLLAPTSEDEHRLMVLADACQSIYGWRWANATEMLRQIERDYRPQPYYLNINYRSDGHIVRAAEAMIGLGTRTVAVESYHATTFPVFEKPCADEHAEAAWIVGQIRRMTSSNTYTFADIAVLYRTHRRADTLETALLMHGIAVERIEDGRFFDDPDVQGTLRYLALVAALHDDTFVPALNWPRVLVDELSMVQLRRTADAAGLSLADLARDIDRWDAAISPLTRAAVRGFMRTIGDELLSVADQPIDVVVTRLLAMLEHRQHAWVQEDREALQGFLVVLGRPLGAAVDTLWAAISARRPVALVHDGSVDAVAAAVLLAHVLQHYWQQTALVMDGQSSIPPECFTIVLGTAQGATPDGFGLALRPAGSTSYSISTQAWRVGQLVLMRAERGGDTPFVVFDLETTSLQTHAAEILEVGAIRVRDGVEGDTTFHSLAKPRHPIPEDVLQVHGIRDRDVQHAPDVANVVADLLRYIGDDIVVGHNIEQYDLPVLRRVAAENGLVLHTHPYVDTLHLARRLLPGRSHRLQDLAAEWNVQVECSHRALDDVRTTANVFRCLLDRLDAEKELDALQEVLPLVAIGIVAAGVPTDGENAVLLHSGSRKLGDVSTDGLMQQIADTVHDWPCFERAYDTVAAYPRRSCEDDERWQRLRTQWQEQLRQYAATGSDQSLTAFLRYAALAQSLDQSPSVEGRVSMMTIHASKGLEWPVVFLVGAEKGLLPMNQRTVSASDEERRLMYVAMTRAQHHLCITWAAERDGRRQKPSPFLDAIPAEHLDRPVERKTS